MLRQPSELEIVFGALAVAGVVACFAYVVCWGVWDMTADGAFWVSFLGGALLYELLLLQQIPEGRDSR